MLLHRDVQCYNRLVKGSRPRPQPTAFDALTPFPSESDNELSVRRLFHHANADAVRSLSIKWPVEC